MERTTAVENYESPVVRRAHWDIIRLYFVGGPSDFTFPQIDGRFTFDCQLSWQEGLPPAQLVVTQ